MKADDFIFDRAEGGKYCDYWFHVVGESKDELTKKYMEQSMIEVTSVVFGIQDGQFGIKRLFPFNYDIVENPDDRELYNILKELAWSKLAEGK